MDVVFILIMTYRYHSFKQENLKKLQIQISNQAWKSSLIVILIAAWLCCWVVLCRLCSSIAPKKERRTFHKIRVEPLANGEQRLKVKKLREQQVQAAVHTFGGE